MADTDNKSKVEEINVYDGHTTFAIRLGDIED